MSAVPPPPGPPDPVTEQKRLWELRLTKAEFWQKVVISLVGAGIVGIFYAWQANQSESHYYADLQAEREKSDASLRSEMFKTLVAAYFNRKSEDGSKASRAMEPSQALDAIEQDVMLSDMLSRNFESVDVRPLFEDLDRRLRAMCGEDVADSFTEDQKRAFALRERLRRVAAGATARERLLLQWSGGTVLSADVKSCPDPKSPDGFKVEVTKFSADKQQETKPSVQGQLPVSIKKGYADYVDVKSLRDGSVSILGPVSGKSDSARPPRFSITFYDMPLLELVRLSSGERVALAVTKYVSQRGCERMRTDQTLSPGEQSELAERCQSLEKDCEWAGLAVTILPEDFITARDRPYLDQLAKRQQGLDRLWNWLRPHKAQ